MSLAATLCPESVVDILQHTYLLYSFFLSHFKNHIGAFCESSGPLFGAYPPTNPECLAGPSIIVLLSL